MRESRLSQESSINSVVSSSLSRIGDSEVIFLIADQLVGQSLERVKAIETVQGTSVEIPSK